MKIQSKLQTWYLVTVFFILIAIMALSFSISLQVEKLFTDYRTSIDRIGLEHAEETFNFLDSTAQDIVLKIHGNAATTLLSLSPSLDKVSPIFIRSFQRMQDMVLPFIRSINVIHVPTGKLITTDQGWIRISGDLIEDMENAYPDLPVLTPLPLKTVVAPNNRKELVFAYLFHDKLPEDKGLSRGVILIIDSKWFFNAVASADDERTGTRFLLYHSRLGILGNGSDDPDMKRLSKSLAYAIEENGQEGSIHSTVGPARDLIDYRILGNSELYLLRLRDDTILRNEINLLRLKISGIALVFIIVVITGSLMVNRQVYKPFHAMVDTIRESIGRRLPVPENDLDLLDALYRNLRDEYSESGEDRIVNSCLRTLSQEETENSGEMIGILGKRGIALSEEKPGILCLVSIDEMDEEFDIQGTEGGSAYTALKYRFRNGMEETLSELRMDSEAIFLRRGVMLVLLYTSEKGIAPNKATVSVLHKMVSDLMGTSVSLVQSQILTDLHGLRQVYLTLAGTMRRRFLLGRGICLEAQGSQIVPGERERDEVRIIRDQIIKKIACSTALPDELDAYLQEIKTWIVTAAQDEINAFSLLLSRSLSSKATDFQAQDLFKRLINQPTLDDFYNIIEEFSEEKEESLVERDSLHSALIDKARVMVETNYSDPAMSLTSVAENLKMSPAYFGMIFKKTVGTPFADYLTMVRIQEAARLLKSTRHSVLEIMNSVGIQSESTFYRRFREIFNLTPQMYRQQSLLNPGERES